MSMPPPPPPKPTKPNHNKIIEEHLTENVSNNGVSSTEEEQVVMTPRGKTSNSTILLIERKLVEKINEKVHVAGGDHKGIIINKEMLKGKRIFFFFGSFKTNFN